MRPDPLLELGRIGLDPAEDGRVVDRDVAVLQHELEVAVADREHQVPAHRPEDYLGGELPTLERLTLPPRRPSAHHAGAEYAASWPTPKLCNRALASTRRHSVVHGVAEHRHLRLRPLVRPFYADIRSHPQTNF